MLPEERARVRIVDSKFLHRHIGLIHAQRCHTYNGIFINITI